MAHEPDLPADIAQRVAAARRAGPWASPSEVAVTLALSRSIEAAPPRGQDVGASEVTAVDLRAAAASAGLESAARELVVSRVFPQGELALVVRESDAARVFLVRGRVWLTAGAQSVRVLLLDGDHVVADARHESGEEFRFEEPLGRGWELEVHLPDGGVVRVSEL